MSKAPDAQSLETYLAQIARELRDLPQQARADEMREIETHLRALVEAGQQLGEIGKAEATALALKQFGEPKRVGRDLRRAWERKQPEAWWCAASAVLFAVDFFFCITMPFMQGIRTFSSAHQRLATNSYQPVEAFASFVMDVQFIAFVLMFAAGYLVGLISPKRRLLAVAAFLVLMSFPNPINETQLAPLWTVVLAMNFVISGAIGSYFGARQSRKMRAHVTGVN